MKVVGSAWLLAVLASGSRSAVAQNLTSQQEIMSHQLVGYDKTMRPSHPAFASSSPATCSSHGAPDVVQITTFIVRVHGVNQIAKSYKMDGTTIVTWYDWRLNYTALSCLDVLDFLTLEDSGGLWLPDIVIAESNNERYGGEIGAMAIEGQRITIRRDGQVTWQRRFRLELGCRAMHFGQMPFDTQYCMFTFLSLRYSIDQITFVESSLESFGASSWVSSEWKIDKYGARSVGLHGVQDFSTLRLCMRLVRYSNSDALAIAVAIFLVCAAYSGFFVTPSAAPARVSLAFLCFLMVLNNLNSILARLPPLLMPKGDGERIWISDFLFGTMIFSFLPLVEYSLVNYGLYHKELKEARKMSTVEKVVSTTNKSSIRLASLVVGDSRVQLIKDKWADWFQPSFLADLDSIFLWLFPLTYAIFLIAMVALIDSYGPELSDCAYDALLTD